MTRILLDWPKGSQMTNLQTATGSGGNRCTEMLGAMTDVAFQLGPSAKAGKTTEQIMYELTEYLNAGRDTSSPENMGVWFSAWLHKNGYDQIIRLSNTTNPTFQTVIAAINRQHVCIGGFNNYINLRLLGGGDPWTWPDNGSYAATHQGEGHVLAIVGYDTDKQTIIVHDPLRADPNGQPAEYTWASFEAAVFHDCTEIIGPARKILQQSGSVQGAAMIPAGWKDNGTDTLTASNGVIVVKGFRDKILSSSSWDAANVPLAAEQTVSQTPALSRQYFMFSILEWTDAKGVYEAPVGQEAFQAVQTIDVLNQTVTQLKQAPATPVPDPRVQEYQQAIASFETAVAQISKAA